MQSLRLSGQQVQQIVNAVQAAHPHEACGMIGGLDGAAVQIVPVNNVADDPQRHYQLDPLAQLQTLKTFEADNLDWLAVYHSHPDGQPVPSLEDIREATLNTPHLVHVLIGTRNRQPNLQAWHIHNGQVDPVELLIGRQTSIDAKHASRLEIWTVLFAVAIGVLLLLTISFILLPPAPPIPTPQ